MLPQKTSSLIPPHTKRPKKDTPGRLSAAFRKNKLGGSELWQEAKAKRNMKPGGITCVLQTRERVKHDTFTDFLH